MQDSECPFCDARLPESYFDGERALIEHVLDKHTRCSWLESYATLHVDRDKGLWKVETMNGFAVKCCCGVICGFQRRKAGLDKTAFEIHLLQHGGLVTHLIELGLAGKLR